MQEWPFLSFLILAIFKVLYFMYIGAIPVCMSMHHKPEMLTEARRDGQVSGNYDYRWFEATILLLEIEPRSSEKAATAFNCSVISLASFYHHNFESRYGGLVDWEHFRVGGIEGMDLFTTLVSRTNVCLIHKRAHGHVAIQTSFWAPHRVFIFSMPGTMLYSI